MHTKSFNVDKASLSTEVTLFWIWSNSSSSSSSSSRIKERKGLVRMNRISKIVGMICDVIICSSRGRIFGSENLT
jgi:hypothetical protein